MYSFLIGGDGNVYEGRGWQVEGAHTRGYNRQGYAACFVGNFSSRRPTSAAIRAAQDLLAVCLIILNEISKMV